MRLPGLALTALCIACLDPTYTHGQASDQHRSTDSIEPYHKHRDTRHGHDHLYPDRGSVVRDLPPGTIGVNYAGASYRYHDGVWLEPRGPAFVVVAPPIGCCKVDQHSSRESPERATIQVPFKYRDLESPSALA